MNQILQQLANLTNAYNQIINQARKIFELPWQNILRTGSKMQVANEEGVSEFITVQQIIDAALSVRQNQLLSIGTITVAGNNLTIPAGANWLINNTNYSNPSNIVINVPYAEDGNTRTDIIVADELNNMYRVNGPETGGVSPAPNVPLNTVLVTTVNVTDDSIGYVPPVIDPKSIKWGYVTATNGGTRVIVEDEDILSVDGSAVTNYTITLPTLIDAKEVSVTFNTSVTNLTINAGGVIDYFPPRAKSYDTYTWVYEPIGNQWILKSYWSGDLGAQINGLPAKTTLLDNDSSIISDSGNSNTPKKFSLLNLWNYIKSKTDILYQRNLNWVTPEQFGAVGDAVTDDKIAVQNAINSGKPVMFAQKRYYISDSINVPAGTTIKGTGLSQLTNILITANVPAFILNGEYITIDGLSIRGTRAIGSASKTLQHGISLKNPSYTTGSYNGILINNCAFYSMEGAGVYIKENGAFGSQSSQIANTYANNCGYGYLLDERAEYNNLNGVVANACGIGLYAKGGNNVVSGSIFSANGTNVYFDGGANDGHTFLSSSEITHAINYNIYSNGIANGYNISDCAIYAGDIYLKNSIGIKFNSCDIGSVSTIFAENATLCEFIDTKFVTTPIFNMNWNGTNNTGTASDIVYFNSKFWGAVTSSIKHNQMFNGIQVSSGNVGINTPASANSLLHIKQNANTFTGGIKLESSLSDTQMNIYFNGSAFVFDSTYGSGGSYNPVKIYTSGLERISFEANGKVKISDLAGTGTRTVVADASGNLSATDIAPTSGTYTPTVTNGANASLSTLVRATYTRVGNVITVSFSVNVTPTLLSGCNVIMTLPVNKTTSGSNLDFGSGCANNGGILLPVRVQSQSSASTVNIIFTAVNTNATNVTGTFQYSTTE